MSLSLLQFAVAGALWWLVAGAIHADDVAAPVDSAEIKRQMEAAAKEYAYFATGDIIANRQTERRWPAEMIAEQAKLLAQLEKWSRESEALRMLIGDNDAKVRTLALGALFVREDPHDLPLVASLADDKAPTFPHAHFSFNSGPPQLQEFIDPQTVGQVAQSMLAAYVRASPTKKDSGFAEYWRIHQGRETCASWFLVKLNRATRQTSPPQPQYQVDVQRVISEVEKLPAVERAWTLIFLRSIGAANLDLARIDPECVASLKEIGPDETMRFLRRERVGDDPDLWFDRLDYDSSHIYSWMAHFVLQHARELLRAEDAPALLAQEQIQREARQKFGLGIFPAWAAAAAELTAASDPAAAGRIIDDALRRFPLSDLLGDRHQADLMASLWRIDGAKESQRIVDWFYEALAKDKRKADELNGAVIFLRSVEAEHRAGTQQLIAALVADPRLDQTGRPAMKALLDIASEGLPQPLVSTRDFFSPEGRTDEALGGWREILRRRYQP
jgi:hypothetical protein